MAIPTQDKRPVLLITGANGLLGQKLVAQAVQEGHFQVLATGRGAARLPEEFLQGVHWVPMDVEQEVDVLAVFQKWKPSACIHTAAMTQVDDCETNREAAYRANVTAVAHIIRACEQAGSHLIHLSTDFIFDGTEGPYGEEALPNPVNYYGETKLEAERLVQAATCPWAIVRTVLVYGIAHDMSRSNIILWVKASLEQGKKIQVVDDQFRTPTLAEDLADGCLRIAAQGAKGIYNISGEDFISPYAMAQQTAAYFGLDASLIQRADSTLFTQPAKRPPVTGFSLEKAKKELGYQPKSFMDGIGILAKQLKLARS
ncbi:MAG: SDR family oxidoreductase [Nitritalea sp.]